MKRILSLLMLIACGIGMGWAQTTTIGLTQSLDDTNKTA